MGDLEGRYERKGEEWGGGADEGRGLDGLSCQ